MPRAWDRLGLLLQAKQVLLSLSKVTQFLLHFAYPRSIMRSVNYDIIATNYANLTTKKLKQVLTINDN